MGSIFSRRSFGFIIILIDLVIIYASIFITYYFFKNSLDAFHNNFYAFVSVSPYIGISYLILNQIFELDKPKDFTFLGVAYSVTLTIICLFLVTMAFSFFTREFAYSRSVLIVSSAIQIIALTLWHLYVNKNFLKENTTKTVLIIGYEKTKHLAYKLLRSNGMWSRIKYICKPDYPNLNKYIDDCDVVFLSEDVDEIKKQSIVEYCTKKYKPVLYEPNNPEILLFNANFTQVDDIPLLKVKSLYISNSSGFSKRLLDVFLSLLALIIFFIPMIIIALILKTGGSAIYKQERVTRKRKVFNIYKFRTMVENAEALSGPTLAQEKDNRITKIGYILRATRLDELPQIVNILRGDMSIVGPRPERPFFVEQFCKEIPEYDLRHRAKAGLTGLAQVQGKYNTSVKDKLKYDLLYINGYSLAWDIKLIMQTLNILLRKSSTEGVSDINYEEEIKKLSQNKLSEDE